MNPLTVSVRSFAVPGYRFDRDEAEWLTAELVDEAGSYYVPIVVRLSDRDTVLDIQTGSCDVAGFWKTFGGSLDSVWVREFNPAGNVELIHRPGTDRQRRDCRYGFDEARAGLAADADPLAVLSTAGGPEWDRVDDGVWRLWATGEYSAGNDRCGPSLSERDPTEPWDGPRQHPGPHMWRTDRPVPAGWFSTPTSPVDYAGGYFEEWGTLLPEPSRALRWLELFWRGRLVHRSTWGRRCLMYMCADDWDNCRDPPYLDYLLERATRP
jgi:hypothetical protein